MRPPDGEQAHPAPRATEYSGGGVWGSAPPSTLGAWLWREAPWLLGVVLGWGLLWWLGHAFVLDEPIEGYGWPGYLNNAWMIVHRLDLGYDTFRRPLHGALVGGLGELLGSYPAGAVVVSSAAMGLLVASAGLAGRVLGGPWAGGLAAAALPTVAANADAARWANDYPLYAGLGGVCMAAALAAARWPTRRGSLLWVVLAGLSGGLAIGTDDRGLVAAAVGVGTLLLSLSPRRLLLWLPVVALGLWLGPLSEDALWIPGTPQLEMAEKLDIQRGVVLRWAHDLHNPEVDAACAGEPLGGLPTVAALRRPCARAILAHNLHDVFPRHLPFGVGLTGLGVLLALLPGRQGWRGTVRSGGWVALALGPLLLQALWVPQPDRYMLAWALPLCVVVPVGVSRAVATLRLPGAARAAAAVALGVWVWRADLAQRWEPSKVQLNQQYMLREALISAVRSRLTPSDQLLDCSELYVRTALLPRLTAPAPPMLKLLSADRCLAWVDAPPHPAEGEIYLVAEMDLELRGEAGVRVTLDAAQLRAAGWVPVVVWSGTGLWRRVW